ncbi:MAG: hypothetical protein HF312_21045 [Ignavibacteria bacterium]|jgi:hypothetical protein|nr:hypothetical protein [Ignavibacteria bacterium]
MANRIVSVAAICISIIFASCAKKNSEPLDMSPIFKAVHKQASLQAKDFEGKFYQFDSTKTFFILTDYNFKATIRQALEWLVISDTSSKKDNLFGDKVFAKQSSKFILIDTLPKWDDVYKKMEPYYKIPEKNITSATFREYKNSSEFNYYLVRMLRPVFDKKKNLYCTALHITDNVFENDGYYFAVKFRIFDGEIKVLSTRMHEISLGLPPEPKEKKE